jgi:hypothetical protein
VLAPATFRCHDVATTMKSALRLIVISSATRLARAVRGCLPLARVVMLLLAMSDNGFAADGQSASPAWWQVAAGVIGIPASLIGLISSFYLIQKTRLEVRKIELELHKSEIEMISKPDGYYWLSGNSNNRARLTALYCFYLQFPLP